MISLDQVLLLEEKVESAVQKIAQLNQENDALRIKCSELTKALSEKTEQLSSFSTDQNKIEEGILKALERLNSVEHSVLKAAALTQQISSANSAPQTEPVQPQPAQPETEQVQPTQTESVQSQSAEITETPDVADTSNTENTSEDTGPSSADADKANGQFYIF